MTNKLRILVVDDHRMVANSLLEVFKLEGYEAEAAHSGAEALDMVKKGHFDWVLSDIRMPEMDGIELCRAIKALQPELPVIFMTAYSEAVDEALKAGAVATLTKPLDTNLLLSFFSSLRTSAP